MGFAQEIRKHLGDILETNSFVLTDQREDSLEYFNAEKRITLRIGMDSLRGNELFLYVMRDGESFDLLQLVEFFSYPRGRIPSAITSAEVSDTALRELKALLSSSEYSLLKGETQFYTSLSDASHARNVKYNEQMQMEFLLQKAQSAWEKKDYTEIVASLRPQRESLPEVWQERLRYAEQRLARKKG